MPSFFYNFIPTSLLARIGDCSGDSSSASILVGLGSGDETISVSAGLYALSYDPSWSSFWFVIEISLI